MKSEAIKKYFSINGEISEVEGTKIFDKIEKPIYEVIRVIDGVPLFLQDHIERMRDSSKLINYKIERSDKDIKDDIKLLIDKNNIKNLNIKLLVSDVDNKQIFLAYFIESFYPPIEYYQEGIKTILYNHERPNPNAKVLLTDFKENIGKELKKSDAFEAILVNNDGTISEGSRSNMFFVKDKKIYTAPGGTVLMGITRKYILKSCEEENIEVIEENIKLDELKNIDGAFMSGTSVDVLPIKTIDDIKLNSMTDSTILKLIAGYNKFVKIDLENNK